MGQSPPTLSIMWSCARFCRTHCVCTDEKHANALYRHKHRCFYVTRRSALWEAQNHLRWTRLLQRKEIDGSLAVCNTEPDLKSNTLFKTTAVE